MIIIIIKTDRTETWWDYKLWRLQWRCSRARTTCAWCPTSTWRTQRARRCWAWPCGEACTRRPPPSSPLGPTSTSATPPAWRCSTRPSRSRTPSAPSSWWSITRTLKLCQCALSLCLSAKVMYSQVENAKAMSVFTVCLLKLTLV